MSQISIRPACRGLMLLVAALVCVGASAAELPGEIRSRPQMTSADTSAIQAYVGEHVGGLTSDDVRVAQQARERLLEPAAGKASVAFRLAYSEALSPALTALYRHADDRVAFNAIRVAGALASPATLDAVRAGLGDARASVRYGSAFAAREAFTQAGQRNAALTDTQIKDLVGVLATTLSTEPEAPVVEGLIAALDATPAGGRLAALGAMALSVSEQARTFGRAGRSGEASAWAGAFQRAVKTIQSSLLEQMRTGKPDEAFAKSSAEMCGSLLAHAKRRLGGAVSAGSEAEWTALGALAADAEGALIFTHLALTGQQQGEQTIKSAWERRDVARIGGEIDRWTGASGRLTKPPYSIPASRFEASN